MLTAFDLYGNQIADYHDISTTKVTPQNPNGQILYTVFVTGTCIANSAAQCTGYTSAGVGTIYNQGLPAQINNGPTPGTYNVSYTVPPNNKGQGSPWTDYNITISHSGGGITWPYGVGPWSVTLKASSNYDITDSCAITNATDGTAGQTSYWNITDLSCADGSHVFSTPSFLVTITSTDAATLGQTISPISVSCVDPKCGQAGIQNYLFNVNFLPTYLIGNFRVRVYAWGYLETKQSSTGSGITVKIGPGPVYPPACSVTGFNGKIQAGNPFTFSVFLADQWKHPINTAGKMVQAIATGPSKQVVTLTNGTFNAGTGGYDFTTSNKLTAAGTWGIKIYEESSRYTNPPLPEIGGLFLQVVVTPGPISHTTSYAVFPPASLFTNSSKAPFTTAGQTGFFTIYPVDAYGNPLSYPDAFSAPSTTAMVQLSDNVAGTSPPNGPSTFTISESFDPTNPNNMILLVTYNATKIMPSDNIIQVQVNDTGSFAPLAGAGGPGPYDVLVTPAAISPVYSTVVPSVPSSIVAGDPLNFTLNAKDIWNNAWLSTEQDNLLAVFQIPGSGGTGTTQQASVTPLGLGSYRFDLDGTTTQQASGWNGTGYIPDYNVSLTYSNGASSQQLSGTGAGYINIPSFMVIAGPTDPTQTVMLVQPYPVIADYLRTYTVVTSDQFGNRRWLGNNDDVEFIFYKDKIDCSGDTVALVDATSTFSFQPSAAATPIGQGAYNVTFKGTFAGLYTINITVKPGGTGPLGSLNCIQTSKLIQEVLPGDPFPPKCWYTISPCDQVPAGGMLNFFLQINDKYGNAVMRTGSQWAVGFYNVPGAQVLSNPLATPLGSLSQPDGLGLDTDTTTTRIDPPSLNAGWVMPTNILDVGTTPYDGKIKTTPPQAIFSLVKDFMNSSYSFTVQVFKGGPAGIVVSAVNGTRWWVVVPPPVCFANNPGSPSTSNVLVVPGGPRQFLPNISNIPIFTPPVNANSFTAAIPNSFILQTMDYYGNNVTTNTHFYQIVIKDVSNQNGYTVDVQSTQLPNGQTQVNVESAWHGTFDLSITLYPNSSIPGADNSAVSPPDQLITIQHATCAYATPSTPYRCPDRTCVASYSACPASEVDTCTASQVYCGASPSCQSSAQSCGYCAKPCDDGHCPTSGSCPPAPVCSTDYVKCPSGGYCRQSLTDCPSAIVCPPGYITCGDASTCARTSAQCPTYLACKAGSFQCPTGACVLSLNDCPTPVSCGNDPKTGAALVVCGTDGSCQTDRTKCPDQYSCYTPTAVRCGGTGVCVNMTSQCPPTTTCLASFVKCPNERCAQNVASCPTNAFTCSLAQVRCPDGSCQNNLLFCASLPTCPSNATILCWDGSCVQYGSQCTYPKQCPSTSISCPGGACAKTKDQCPTDTRCPDATPVLCTDGSCTDSNTNCPTLAACPIEASVRCPDGQSCRAQLSDCPTIVTCQANQVKCADGTCGVAADKCPSNVSAYDCPAGFVRCGGGNCVTDYSLCPTSVTCGYGYAKCSDGSCHQKCPTTYNTCPAGNVTCPQSSAGVQCAPFITACPVSFICPFPSVVRCLDASCAPTADKCPPPPPDTSYVTNKVPCPDGTYAADATSCPTPVTCPSATPYKCFDGTCRVGLTDCPQPKLCPAGPSGETQYKCSNGECNDFPWDCTTSGTPCPAATPFQCPPDATCASNILQCCQATAADCDKSINPITSCNASAPCTKFCPDGYFYCLDGSCAKLKTDCSPLTCPSSLPVLCNDGLCVDDKAHCNTASGCPWNAPEKCPSGLCLANFDDCASVDTAKGIPTCQQLGFSTACNDGSCATSSTFCPGSASGCNADQIRCYDGSCATNCTSPSLVPNSDVVNACPESYPYRCPDGFCSKSLPACPYPLVNANCSGTTPFQCAVGTCVVASTQCPPLYPCLPTQTRCGDGSCRVVTAQHTCPLADTCPGTSFRCNTSSTGVGSGLCTNDATLCSINVTTGCPATQTKCPTGQCTSTTCDSLPSATGCTGTQVKCYDGSCKASQNACNLPDGCATGTVRCPYGDCQSDPSLCQPNPTPGTVKCADGSWVPSPGTTCPGLNGCPMGTPIRCADGTCAKFTATVAVSQGGCPPTVTCPTGQYLCAGASCSTTQSQCPSVAPCAAGTIRCPATFRCQSQASCGNSSLSYCPSSLAPILCPDGTCAKTIGQCIANAGGPINQNCPLPNVRCIDESCVSYTSKCIQQSLCRDGDCNQQLAAACPGMVMCPDGSCRPDARQCGIIPRCPLGYYRCPDGTCKSPTNPAVNPCNQNVQPACLTGYTRCEDGTCRKVNCDAQGRNCKSECLEYDGCGLQYPYACPFNRECAFTTKSCAVAGQGNPVLKASYRRLLQNSAITQPCMPATSPSGFCLAEIKAALTSITVDTTKSSSVDIALDPNTIPRMTLRFSSGSFVLTDGSTVTGFGIRPVGESRMRYAVNEIHASRKIQFGGFLPFSATVLTPAFECEVDQTVKEPFNLNVTVVSDFDQRPGIVNESDICLARLVELPGFTTWRCLFPSPADRNVKGPYYVKKDPTLFPGQVSSVISFCTPQTNSETGVQSTTRATAYAFIWSPLPAPMPPPDGPDVIQRNIVWIILGVLLGIAGLVLLTYCAFRLYRYRNKYKEQKEEADRLQEEVENMRQFGGEAGNKDDQVNMTANPLAVQLKDVQAKFNEEDVKLQEAEQNLRKQEGEIRQEHIKNMRENRDQLARQLEQLKRQLAETQASNQPKATYDEDAQGGASYETNEPVREEFDGGQTSGGGAQPRRQKRDL